MSGVHGQMLSHVVKRAQDHMGQLSAATMSKLQHDATLYDEADPKMRMNPMEFLPVAITALLLVIFLFSVRNTSCDNVSQY